MRKRLIRSAMRYIAPRFAPTVRIAPPPVSGQPRLKHLKKGILRLTTSKDHLREQARPKIKKLSGLPGELKTKQFNRKAAACQPTSVGGQPVQCVQRGNNVTRTIRSDNVNSH